MIKNSGIKIKMGIAAVLFFSSAIFYYLLSLNRVAFEDFYTFLIVQAVLLFSCLFGLTSGLIFSLLGIVVYGANFFRQALAYDTRMDIGVGEAIWLMLIVASALVGGYLGNAATFVQKLFSKYKQQIDTLLMTGQLGMIGNIVTFNTGLREECSRARRAMSQFTVLLLDIANLSQLRRALGADADEVAANQLSQALARGTRDIDKKARIEDVLHGVVAPDCTKKNVHIMIDRITKNLAQAQMNVQGKNVKSDIKLAIGQATYPEDGDTPEKLLEHAKKDLEKKEKK
jgi:diguanylate cyclase (GGDEF)-like protein